MSSTNHNLSQRSSSFRGPWRHEPINSVSFHPLTSPRAAPRGCRAPSNVLHISSGSTGAGWKWPLGHRIPPRYNGHRSLFPLNPTLKQEKKDLWSKKKVWFLKHILCFYSSLFLSFSLFLFISQEKTFFFYCYLNIALNTSITGWCDSTNTFQIQMDSYHLRSSKWSPHVLNELMAHMWQPEHVWAKLALSHTNCGYHHETALGMLHCYLICLP